MPSAKPRSTACLPRLSIVNGSGEVFWGEKSLEKQATEGFTPILRRPPSVLSQLILLDFSLIVKPLYLPVHGRRVMAADAHGVGCVTAYHLVAVDNFFAVQLLSFPKTLPCFGSRPRALRGLGGRPGRLCTCSRARRADAGQCFPVSLATASQPSRNRSRRLRPAPSCIRRSAPALSCPPSSCSCSLTPAARLYR